jgi:hypothetical protein
MSVNRRQFLQTSLAIVGLSPATFGPARAEAANLGFDDLYERETVLTERVKALDGQPVQMRGYMAPPLKAEATFFVLTRTPMSVCPFCETEMQWPDDIVLVLTEDVTSVAPYNVPIEVTGELDLGFEKDPETGFVSLIRLKRARYERS